MEILKEPILLICDCSSAEHQIIVRHDEDDKLMYCSIHLAKLPFLERLKAGINYIFGYECRYGHFEEFILSEKHADKLEMIAKSLK